MAGARTTRPTATTAPLVAWLQTDVGVVREHNEDSAHSDPARGFFIVADGMGGHAAGEVASAMAVDAVRAFLEVRAPVILAFAAAPSDDGRRAVEKLLQDAVHAAHKAVFERGSTEADKAGMGTTLEVVVVAAGEVFVAHVGDSRTYLIRAGQARQLTTDHTVAEVMVIEGKLTPEEALHSPMRTVLVNALGVSPDIGVELAHEALEAGDRLLVCSDGLHDYFPTADEVGEVLGRGAGTAGAILGRMVKTAKDRGGHDNITGIAIEYGALVATGRKAPTRRRPPAARRKAPARRR